MGRLLGNFDLQSKDSPFNKVLVINDLAVRLDAAKSSYVKIAPLPGSVVSGGFTIEVYAKLTNASQAYGGLFEISESLVTGNSKNSISLRWSGNAMFFGIYHTGESDREYFTFDARSNYTDVWTRFTVTFSATGIMRYYTNGVQKVSRTFTRLPAEVDRTLNYIGRCTQVSDQVMDGWVANAKMWTRELTAEEVAGGNVKESLVEEWNMSGSTIGSQFINTTVGSPAQLMRGAEIVPAGNPFTKLLLSQPKTPYAINLNGGTATLPYRAELQTEGEYTFDAVFRVNSLGTQTIIARLFANSVGYGLRIESTGVITYTHYKVADMTVGSVEVGKWTRVTVVADATTNRTHLYNNLNYVRDVGGTSYVPVIEGTPMSIGGGTANVDILYVARVARIVPFDELIPKFDAIKWDYFIGAYGTQLADKTVGSIAVTTGTARLVESTAPVGQRSSLSFNGTTNNYINLDSLVPKLKQVTSGYAAIGFYIKPNKDHKTGVGNILSMHTSDTGGSKYFSIIYGNTTSATTNEVITVQLQTGISSESSSYSYLDNVGNYVGKWLQVVLVMTPTEWKLRLGSEWVLLTKVVGLANFTGTMGGTWQDKLQGVYEQFYLGVKRGSNAYFGGELSNLFILDREPTEQELKLWQHNYLPKDTTGLVEHFKLTEGVGAAVYGEKGFIGTFVNNPVWQIPTVANWVNQCAKLIDNTGWGLETQRPIIEDLSKGWLLEFHLRLHANTANRGIIEIPGLISIRTTATGGNIHVSAGIRNSPRTIETGIWMHFCVWYGGSGDPSIRVNNIHIGSIANTSPEQFKTNGNLRLGNISSTSIPALMDIDEVRLWKFPKPQVDVGTDMYRVLDRNKELIGYWRMDGNGWDASGHGNHLVPVGYGEASPYVLSDSPMNYNAPINDWIVGSDNGDTPVDRTPDWQKTGLSRCIKDGVDNTGDKELEEKDRNPHSLTADQSRWVSGGTDLELCPLPIDDTPASNCAVFVHDPTGAVYTYEPTTDSLIFRFRKMSVNTPVDIANTATKLWLSYGRELEEWDITLHPFTATYNRRIALPVDSGSGLTCLDNNTIIGSYTPDVNSKCRLVKFDITNRDNVTFETLFEFPVGRITTGDMVYNEIDDVYLITMTDQIADPVRFYITQFSSNGQIQADIETSVSTMYGLFDVGGVLRAADDAGNIYAITEAGVNVVGNIGTSIWGGSQSPYCTSANLVQQTQPDTCDARIELLDVIEDVQPLTTYMFEDNFESGTGFETPIDGEYVSMHTSHPWSFTVVSSPVYKGLKSGRFELNKTDTMNHSGTRAEASFTDTSKMAEGWYSWAGYFPSTGWVTEDDDTVIAQWHGGSGAGSPVCSLREQNGKLLFRIQDPDGIASTKKFELSNFTHDVWHQLVFHIVFHPTGGRAEVWYNGVKKVDWTGYTMKAGFELPKLKLGIYKSDWNTDTGESITTKRVWYVDNVKIGNSASTYSDMIP